MAGLFGAALAGNKFGKNSAIFNLDVTLSRVLEAHGPKAPAAGPEPDGSAATVAAPSGSATAASTAAASAGLSSVAASVDPAAADGELDSLSPSESSSVMGDLEEEPVDAVEDPYQEPVVEALPPSSKAPAVARAHAAAVPAEDALHSDEDSIDIDTGSDIEDADAVQKAYKAAVLNSELDVLNYSALKKRMMDCMEIKEARDQAKRPRGGHQNRLRRERKGMKDEDLRTQQREAETKPVPAGRVAAEAKARPRKLPQPPPMPPPSALRKAAAAPPPPPPPPPPPAVKPWRCPQAAPPPPKPPSNVYAFSALSVLYLFEAISSSCRSSCVIQFTCARYSILGMEAGLSNFRFC